MPIDYWDYLGWKDTLADPRNTARQKGYAKSRGDGQVYTPQVGGERQRCTRSAATGPRSSTRSPRAARTAVTLSVPVTLAIADGRVSVSAPDGAPPPRGSVESGCARCQSRHRRDRRGENKGRTVTYHNVVRRWVKLGDWTGKANAWSLRCRRLRGDGIDSAAVLVQSGTR